MAYIVLTKSGIAVSLACVVISFYFLGLIVYRIFLHPLRNIPGPFLAKVSDAYSAYLQYGGKMHLRVKEWHDRYGDTVRYGPNRVLTLSESAMSDIYDTGRPFRKSASYNTMVPLDGAPSTATVIDKGHHRLMRKALVPGFSVSNLKKYEPAIHRNFERYMSSIVDKLTPEGQWTAVTDLRIFNQCLAMDTVAEYGLGLRLDLWSNPDKHAIHETLGKYVVAMGVYEHWPWLCELGLSTIVSRLLPKLPAINSFSRWHADFVTKSFEVNKNEAHGIIGHIISGVESKSSQYSYSRTEAITEGSFITFTGSDGLSTAYSGVQHYLAYNKEAYEKLATELRTNFEIGKRVEAGPRLDSCEYLQACLYEAMRLLPSTCGVHWRESEEPVHVGGSLIPAGTDIGVSHFTLTRDSRIYRSPESFWPDRWVKGVLPEEERSLAKKNFPVFSVGLRSCSGSGVVWFVLKLWVANLLVNYDFEIADDARQAGMKPEDRQLHFDSHWTLPAWEKGPFLRFKKLVAPADLAAHS